MKSTRPSVAIGLVLLAAATSACATYQPAASRFISRDAQGTYHRDGQRFDVGTFGTSAESLVSREPHALEHVRRYKHLNHVGTTVYLLGLVATLVGPFLVGAVVPHDWALPAGFGAIGVGLGVSTAGITISNNGDAALIDAVNTYNDQVADRPNLVQP